MVKISDCSHMEIKKIYACNIEINGKKVVCFLDIADVNEYSNPKKLSISISNLYNLLTAFGITKLNHIVGMEARCLVHQKYQDINFIGPSKFEVKYDEYTRCNQVVMS